MEDTEDMEVPEDMECIEVPVGLVTTAEDHPRHRRISITDHIDTAAVWGVAYQLLG